MPIVLLWKICYYNNVEREESQGHQVRVLTRLAPPMFGTLLQLEGLAKSSKNLLTQLQKNAIIYLQGKERGKQKKEKNLKKPLDKPKSSWYNKDKIKEGQQNQNRVVGRAKRLLIT